MNLSMEGLLGGLDQFFNPKAPQGAGYDDETARMARATLLGNIGGSLLQAGQGGTPLGTRGAALAQLGQAPAAAAEVLRQGVTSKYNQKQAEVLQSQLDSQKREDAYYGVGAPAPGAAPAAVAPTGTPAPAAAPGGVPGGPAPTVAAAANANAPQTGWLADAARLGLSPEQAMQIARMNRADRNQVVQALTLDRLKPREVWKDIGNGIQQNTVTGERKPIEGSQVKIDMGKENKIVDLDAGIVKGNLEAAQPIAALQPKLRMMRDMLMTGQVKTDGLQPLLMPFKSVLAAIGGLDEKTLEGYNGQQFFEALRNNIAPNMKVAGSGAQSDKDIKLLFDAMAGLGQSPEAALMTAAFMNQAAEYQTKYARLQMNYLRTKKSLEGFDEYAEKALGGVIPTIPADADRASQEAAHKAIPVGTLYKTPAGNFVVKR